MPTKKSTDAAEAPSLADLAALVEEQGKAIKDFKLADQIRRTRAPAGLPQAPTTKSIMKGLEGVGDSISGQNRYDPTGLRPAFRPNDVVALVNEDKLRALTSKGYVKNGEQFLGVVVATMYRRRRDNQMQYNVDFPGIGKDGALESDLELVQAYE